MIDAQQPAAERYSRPTSVRPAPAVFDEAREVLKRLPGITRRADRIAHPFWPLRFGAPILVPEEGRAVTGCALASLHPRR